jgi:hypothetical protein
MPSDSTHQTGTNFMKGEGIDTSLAGRADGKSKCREREREVAHKEVREGGRTSPKESDGDVRIRLEAKFYNKKKRDRRSPDVVERQE